VSQTAATKRGAPEFLDALCAEGLRVHENHGSDGNLRGYDVGGERDTDRAGKQVLFGGRTLARTCPSRSCCNAGTAPDCPR